ncbi:MAG: GGDEF domain-containing protein, partial [Isosphaeraceae bacterium]|nr:GGDEF domain-containing protein [Isosphaeraceae bacterium]
FITFGMRRSMPISVVMIDVDHFKSYNDTFGHTAGDEILVRFGRALVENVRDHDVVARYGGEEFVILLPATDESTSRRIAERIREAIEAIPWESRPITASLGVSTVLAEPLSPRHLIDRADEALYRAKLDGRNRVRHACELSSSCLPDPVEPNVESASPSGAGRFE